MINFEYIYYETILKLNLIEEVLRRAQWDNGRRVSLGNFAAVKQTSQNEVQDQFKRGVKVRIFDLELDLIRFEYEMTATEKMFNGHTTVVILNLCVSGDA